MSEAGSLTTRAAHPNHSGDLQAAAHAWANGWAISRGLRSPIEHSGYLEIFVGRPEQTTRYILPYLDERLLRMLVSSRTGPGSWLKICAPSESVSPSLSDRWKIHEPEFLMSADLHADHASSIQGYRSFTERAGSVLFARLLTDTGEIAASGQAALFGSFATFDRILTSEVHRRKGLGRRIMAMLSDLSLKSGATMGVLVATEAGAALYDALGWSTISPVTAASFSI